MKTLAAIAIALGFTAPAFANQTVANPNVTCENIAVMEFTTNGTVSMKPTGISVKVEPAQGQSPYGYQATLSSPEGTYITTDAYMLPASPEKLAIVKEMAASMAPEVKWNEVTQVIVSNVGVKENKEDGAGIFVFDLQTKDGATLVKLATVGWGFGRCSK